MGKWVNQSINSAVEPATGDHIDIEDLARLADDNVQAEERQHMIGHLNRCQRCYDILQETLKDASAEASLRPASVPWWKSRMTFALAASIILVVLVGGMLTAKFWMPRSPVILASLNLDLALKDILLENDAVKWEQKDRIQRLLTALQQRGLPVNDLDLVMLAKPYYQKKSLFGPAEVLHIRIENKVAYLEVKEKDK